MGTASSETGLRRQKNQLKKSNYKNEGEALMPDNRLFKAAELPSAVTAPGAFPDFAFGLFSE